MLKRYYHWLHGKWPAGKIEKLPEVGDDGATNVAGIRIVGDLSGIPLLKFSSETGARAVQAILAEADFSGQQKDREDDVYDLVIIGAGVSGVSAAMEAKKAGLKYLLLEASQVFSTVANFPKGKPIFTYPTDMTPSGGIQYSDKADVKEALLEEMKQQISEAGVEVTEGRIERLERKGGQILLHPGGKDPEPLKSLRCIVAIGRSGNFRKMGVPGEDLDKVSNRLHDPKAFGGKDVLIVGGGDSAAEAAIALTACGAKVTLAYRGDELTRPKPENVKQLQSLAEDPCAYAEVTSPSSERITTAANSSMRGDAEPGCLTLALNTSPTKVGEDTVTLKEGKDGEEQEIPNDAVFAMIGREAPLGFFRRSNIRISGEWSKKMWIGFMVMALCTIWMYHWKSGKINIGPDPSKIPAAKDATTFGGIIVESLRVRWVYYTMAYCSAMTIFGIRRIRRRKTPYVTRQTISLLLFQWIPLYILPVLVLPWMGAQGMFEGGLWKGFADWFLRGPSGDIEYWRAFGFVLAWPLFVANWFTETPLWGWLILGGIQTFVIIPWIVRRWGKGAYCGWVCSCGGLAETMGDAHRHKMPHGPKVNRFNMIGQVFLFAAAILMVLRIIGWIFPDSFAGSAFTFLFKSLPVLNYEYFVDLIFAGIVGVAAYFHFSGRVWCRFACPLAALMHIYSRFGKFRIFPEKSKCISCNVCTTVCHQGIDIMNFANKGAPMEDPECVRCSACVQQCPTGVLSFGRLTNDGKGKILDTLPASPVQMKELARKSE